jgi:hypothetical protein
MKNSKKALMLVTAFAWMGHASPYEHARVFFEQANFEKSLEFLKQAPQDKQTLWLKAESLFGLKKYYEARLIYEHLTDYEKQKAYLRILECNIYLADKQKIIASYENYKKIFSSPIPDRILYKLGKFLYNAGDKQHGREVLNKISNNSDFSMRALYILAVIDLDTLSPEQAVEKFKHIAALKPRAVEDYTTQQMALLAVARVWADARRYEQARLAYEEVALWGAYADIATAELIELMIFWADSLQPNFNLLADRALGYATDALMRYRAVNNISFKNSELYTQMGRLFIRTKRYDDGRMTLENFSKYYQDILDLLESSKGNPELIWPIFDLEKSTAQFFELPKNINQKLPNINAVLDIKSQLQQEQKVLNNLKNSRQQNINYQKAATNLPILITNYHELARLAQANIRVILKPLLKDALANVAQIHGDLALAEMQDVQKKIQSIGKFQSEKIINFEKNIATIGGPL